MPDQLQLRGGTTTEHNTFTGASKEVTVDTAKKTAVVHDGTTAGGNPLMREDGTNSALIAGSAGSPSIKFDGDTDTGIYSPGANQLAISTNGTERARIDGSGRLLVGTSSVIEGYQLQLEQHIATAPFAGSILLRRGLANAGLSAGYTLGTIGAGSTTNVGGTISFTADAAWGSDDYPTRIEFLTTADGNSSPTERMRIDSSGNVGIGTTSPQTDVQIGPDAYTLQLAAGYRTLSIADTTNGAQLQLRGLSPKLFFDSTSGGNGEIYLDDAPLAFFSGNPDIPGSERARIDGSGRLLVGTSSDLSGNSTKLQVSTAAGGYLGLAKNDTTVTSGNEIGGLRFYANDPSPSAFNLVAEFSCEADGDHASNDYPTRLVFRTTADGESSPTERVRITEDGQLLVFTNTSNVFSSVRTSGSSYHTVFKNNSSGINGGTIVCSVQADGDLQNTNNSYTGISDIKLKENIVNASSQWDDLKALQVRNYNFKAETGFNTHTQIGLIAQEVELVSPGLVDETIDEETGDSIKSVNYSVLYMKAVKALQEAMERIETLEQRLSNAGIV